MKGEVAVRKVQSALVHHSTLP
ncbi:protein of unknown function [Methanoculleus bourgensis]|uniref:Uncharacterized protein n=1 Tax=Methanoculleus bourgensis TaxID=83986 RepID=A0A0X3BJ66_9EURY|nr:protein of unknown function [Methanoculleus bourgensis]